MRHISLQKEGRMSDLKMRSGSELFTVHWSNPSNLSIGSPLLAPLVKAILPWLFALHNFWYSHRDLISRDGYSSADNALTWLPELISYDKIIKISLWQRWFCTGKFVSVLRHRMHDVNNYHGLMGNQFVNVSYFTASEQIPLWVICGDLPVWHHSVASSRKPLVKRFLQTELLHINFRQDLVCITSDEMLFAFLVRVSQKKTVCTHRFLLRACTVHQLEEDYIKI